ncbi:MFS transporter [Streptomyces sp. NPDC014894]|uniref:MFS transporter n=1 Tax=Streptomyces sp. NPDC014894 TaxID=3364931 RepID=UPI0036F79FAD
MRQELPAAPARPARRWTLLVVSLAQLMAVLDATIVNVALPSVQQGLGVADAERHWAVTAYSLALGGSLLLGGRVCGALGHRRSFAAGLIGFAAASALGGAAGDAGTFFAARALQGLSAALMAPAALALLSMTFPDPRERGRAFGVFAGVGAGGAALGVVSGGLLTEYAGWRWCLYINVPMAALALLGTPLLRRDRPGRGPLRLDLPGVLLSAAGIAALVGGLSQAESRGWGDPLVLLPLLGGAGLLALFARVEARARHPLLPPGIVLHRVRGIAFVSVGLMFTAMFGFFLFMSYYTQTVLGYTAVGAGLTLLVNAAASVVGSTVVAGRLLVRADPRTVVVAALLSSAAGILILTRLTADSAHVLVVYLLPAQVLTGIGLGCLLATAANLVTSGTGPADAGVASGAYNAVQQVGAALGTALFNSVATAGAAAYAASRESGPEALSAGAVHGYTAALWAAFALLACGALAVGALSREDADRAGPVLERQSTEGENDHEPPQVRRP